MERSKKEDIIIYIICLLITIIIFIPFLQGHYIADTYNIESLGYENYAMNYSIKDGRAFMGILNIIAGKTNISIELYIFLTLFLALIVSNISVMIINKIIERYKTPSNLKQKILITIISYVTIFNFMYLDCLQFAESFIISLSVVLYIIAADILVQKNKLYLIKSIGVATIAVFCYQSSMSMFFAFLFLFSILKNKNNVKEIIKDILRCILITIIILIANFVFIKIVGYIFNLNQNRVSISFNIILRNIKIIKNNFFNVVQESCTLFPKNLFLIFYFTMLLVTTIYVIRNKKPDSFIYKLLCIAIVSILTSFVLNIISSSSFYGGRTRLSIGATIGIIFIFLYVETDIYREKGINIIISILLCAYSIINIYNYGSLIIQHKEVNILEEQEMIEIENYISEYEKAHNIDVEKIVKVLIFKQQYKQYYEGTKQNSFTASALRSSEFADKVLNVHSKRAYESELIYHYSEEAKEYLEIENNDKGYECIGDSLYISVYAY